VHLAAGHWLGENFPPDSLLATSNAGAAPFASGLPTLDMLGLCDAHIASRPVGEMGQGTAATRRRRRLRLDRRPRLILFQLTRFSDAPLTLAQAARPLW